MGIGPNPGEFYRLKCVNKTGTTVDFANGSGTTLRLVLPTSAVAELKYYTVGKEYDFSVVPEPEEE